MKRILVITVVFCLIGVLTGTAQEVLNDPPGFEKSSTPPDKMQRAWLWREGTKFTGTTLVFTSNNKNNNKIEIKPSKEKLHIYAKKYDSHWINPSFFFGFKPNAAAWIRTGGHMYADGPNKTIGEDYSDVTFKFENLKVDGSEMTGICFYKISYGFKGDKELKEVKEDNVPVKFTSHNLPTKEEITKFNQRVDEKIRWAKELNPEASNFTISGWLDEQRAARGDNDPAMVAAQHWYLGRFLNDITSWTPAIIQNTGGLIGPIIWERVLGPISHKASIGGGRPSGQRIDPNTGLNHENQIIRWGAMGMIRDY